MRVSVVINTLNRAEPLAVALHALEYLDYEQFEVIVVNGPSEDNTSALLRAQRGRVKWADCPDANLSQSRNVGIAMAAGDVVAFLDDDAYPDPAWLDRLVEGYDDPEVAAVGGPVLDHTGVALQVQYLRSNRFGRSQVEVGAGLNPSYLLSVPGASHFPSLLGANSSFRRSVLSALGGFDEEFDYFLDETDVCVRLVDRGFVVRMLDDGFVYHKFLPSSIRKADRIPRVRYSVIKNSIYFALRHGRRTASFAATCEGIADTVRTHREDMRGLWEAGRIELEELVQFEADVERGSEIAFDHALRPPRTRAPRFFADPPPFLLYPRRSPPGRKLHVALVTREHPPGAVNGVGRIFAAQAHALASRGHVVHVVTAGAHHDTVDFEDGVWVHRSVPRGAELPWADDGVPGSSCGRANPQQDVPAPVASWTATVRKVVEGIHGRRPLDVVMAPSWDSEGLALLNDPVCPLVVSLVTPLPTVLAMDAGIARGDRRALEQLLAAERRCVYEADFVVATGPWTVEEVERGHGIDIAPARRLYASYGLPDLTEGVKPEPLGPGPQLLFVGRLEPRKGLDLLMACLPELLQNVADLEVNVAGEPVDHSITGLLEAMPAPVSDRVHLLGRVDERRLLRLYAACDVVVMPSRYESFGLVLVEAMSFGKPVVASRVGGMEHIVDHGVTGLLVEPDDSIALGKALVELHGDAELRARLGAAGRARYEVMFSAPGTAEQLEAAFCRAARVSGQRG